MGVVTAAVVAIVVLLSWYVEAMLVVVVIKLIAASVSIPLVVSVVVTIGAGVVESNSELHSILFMFIFKVFSLFSNRIVHYISFSFNISSYFSTNTSQYSNFFIIRTG